MGGGCRLNLTIRRFLSNNDASLNVPPTEGCGYAKDRRGHPDFDEKRPRDNHALVAILLRVQADSYDVGVNGICRPKQ